MDLNNKDIIVFNNELNDDYQSGISNTVKVEDLINQLELLPKLRELTKDVEYIQKADGTVVKEGHIKIKLSVEYETTRLENT